MTVKRIIPCLDVKDGRVVKGVSFANLRDVGDPAELARRYESQGCDELVLLDIAAAGGDRKATQNAIGQVAAAVTVPLTVGGGIASLEDMQFVLVLGAAKVAVNTVAVRDPGLISRAARALGSRRIVVAIDARWSDDCARVCIHGGCTQTDLEVTEWARTAEKLGAGELLLTSIDDDGSSDGYDLELLQAVTRAVDIPVIASGGGGCPEHMYRAVTTGGAAAVLAASMFHDGRYTVGDVKQYLLRHGVPVRLAV